MKDLFGEKMKFMDGEVIFLKCADCKRDITEQDDECAKCWQCKLEAIKATLEGGKPYKIGYS